MIGPCASFCAPGMGDNYRVQVPYLDTSEPEIVGKYQFSHVLIPQNESIDFHLTGVTLSMISRRKTIPRNMISTCFRSMEVVKIHW